MVLITGDEIVKVEMRDEKGEIDDKLRKLMKLRDLIWRELEKFEKDPARRA